MIYYVIILSKFGITPSNFPGPHAPLAVYFCEGFFIFKSLVRSISTYSFQHCNTEDLQFAVITTDARFNMWLVPMVCIQLQLNLRNAIHHIPSYVTNYYQRQVVGGLNRRLGQAGVDTLSFGRTATGLELRDGNFSTGSEGGQLSQTP